MFYQMLRGGRGLRSLCSVSLATWILWLCVLVNCLVLLPIRSRLLQQSTGQERPPKAVNSYSVSGRIGSPADRKTFSVNKVPDFDVNNTQLMNLSLVKPIESNKLFTESNSTVSSTESTNTKVTRHLTLFTTFKLSEDRRNVYTSVIRNWALLGPSVYLVLYTSFMQDALVTDARRSGWYVYGVPKHNKYNTPYIRDMFLHAQQNFPSHFYGYANGDLYFNEELIGTLKAAHNLSTTEYHNGIMIIGRRTNYVLNNTQRGIPFYTIPELFRRRSTLAKEVRIHGPLAVDYFITSRQGFNWQDLPDLVVGRAGYDNYIVYHAIYQDNLTLIDASRSVRALHLQGPDWQLTHRTDMDPDKKYNLRVINGLHKFRNASQLLLSGNVNSAHLESYYFAKTVKFRTHIRRKVKAAKKKTKKTL